MLENEHMGIGVRLDARRAKGQGMGARTRHVCPRRALVQVMTVASLSSAQSALRGEVEDCQPLSDF
jgi:hypothetical protein